MTLVDSSENESWRWMPVFLAWGGTAALHVAREVLIASAEERMITESKPQDDALETQDSHSSWTGDNERGNDEVLELDLLDVYEESEPDEEDGVLATVVLGSGTRRRESAA
jgi:hypothetical protein